MLYEKKLFNGKSTIFEIGERKIRNLKFFWEYMDGKKSGKRRNFAKVYKESVNEFWAKQKKHK